MEFSTPSQAIELKQWFTEPATDIDAKIAAVKEILMFQVVHKQLKMPYRTLPLRHSIPWIK
jgi:hypothetical protein